MKFSLMYVPNVFAEDPKIRHVHSKSIYVEFCSSEHFEFGPLMRNILFGVGLVGNLEMHREYGIDKDLQYGWTAVH